MAISFPTFASPASQKSLKVGKVVSSSGTETFFFRSFLVVVFTTAFAFAFASAFAVGNCAGCAAAGAVACSWGTVCPFARSFSHLLFARSRCDVVKLLRSSMRFSSHSLNQSPAESLVSNAQTSAESMPTLMPIFFSDRWPCWCCMVMNVMNCPRSSMVSPAIMEKKSLL